MLTTVEGTYDFYDVPFYNAQYRIMIEDIDSLENGYFYPADTIVTPVEDENLLVDFKMDRK